MLKCSAILGDFFLKSDQIILEDSRTNIRVIEVKSEKSEKILGLVEDDPYHENDIYLSESFLSEAFGTRDNLQWFPLVMTVFQRIFQR